MSLLTALGLVGIMSAMPEEGELILKEMNSTKVHAIGSRVFYEGRLQDRPVIFTLSGIGKVSAAVTATLLIDKFQVDEVIFTGTAGGGTHTAIGDIVIGNQFLQHDLDLTPIFSKFYIYSLDKQVLEADLKACKKMIKAASKFAEQSQLIWQHEPLNITVHEGLIISGDRFISSKDVHDEIQDSLKVVDHNAFYAVEMEGAAVAQVCHELGKPFVVVRSISDKADNQANHHFLEFVNNVAKYYGVGVIKEYLK